MSDWIWEPPPEFARATNVWRYMQRLGFSDREEFLRYSVDHLVEFWGDLAVELGVEWFAPFTKVLDASRGVEWARWYIGAKLNIASNTLDRHARGARANRTAIVSESEDGTRRELTFAELAREVNQVANALRDLDLQPGDRVALVMPMVADVVTVLYACFKLGLVPVLIFAGFGAGAIESRLRDSGARVVFTASHLTRRGKRLPLVEKVREAAANCPSVEHIFEELPRGSERHCPSMPMDSEAPALMLYTSGTTGKPKGVVHTHAGALIQTAKEIYLAFDHQDADRFFWLSDIGWMMGPWSIIGNHHFGGTIFMYDGAPDWPDPNRLWRTLERERITTFGVSPTLIRALMRTSDPSKFDLSALRLLGSTGRAMGRRLLSLVLRADWRQALSDHQHLRWDGDHRLFPIPATYPTPEVLHPRRTCARHGRGSRQQQRATGARRNRTSGLHQACAVHDARDLGRPRTLSQNLLVAFPRLVGSRRLG